MKPLDQLPFWKRAIFWNVIAVGGAYIGTLSSGVKLALVPKVYIACLVIALMNFLFLAVRPRIYAQRTVGVATSNPWRVLYEIVVVERPFMTVLLILQLIRASQAAAAAILFFHAQPGDLFRDPATAQSMIPYIYYTACYLTAIAVAWLLSAIGLWSGRLWAWWLALFLNGLGVVLQLLNLHKFSLDPLSAIAAVLLFLPAVRKHLRSGQSALQQVAR